MKTIHMAQGGKLLCSGRKQRPIRLNHCWRCELVLRQLVAGLREIARGDEPRAILAQKILKDAGLDLQQTWEEEESAQVSTVSDDLCEDCRHAAERGQS